MIPPYLLQIKQLQIHHPKCIILPLYLHYMSICSILPIILDPHGSESYIYALFTLYSHGIPTVTYHFLRSILYLHSSHYCHDIFPPKKIFRNSHYSPWHCHDPILFPLLYIHPLSHYITIIISPLLFLSYYPLSHYITIFPPLLSLYPICSTFFPPFLEKDPQLTSSSWPQRWPPTPRPRAPPSPVLGMRRVSSRRIWSSKPRSSSRSASSKTATRTPGKCVLERNCGENRSQNDGTIHDVDVL